MIKLSHDELLRNRNLQRGPEQARYEELLRHIDNNSLCDDEVIAGLLKWIGHLQSGSSEIAAHEATRRGWDQAHEAARQVVDAALQSSFPGESAAEALKVDLSVRVELVDAGGDGDGLPGHRFGYSAGERGVAPWRERPPRPAVGI
ncbi:MAG: hypothetical protein JF617_07890, partial [Burkholderiales bacterium]|nr:hypothetical protein [Burkholderiales bacterium]